jgi:hypothetical protein
VSELHVATHFQGRTYRVCELLLSRIQGDQSGNVLVSKRITKKCWNKCLIVVVTASQDSNEDHITMRERDFFMAVDGFGIIKLYIVQVIITVGTASEIK